MISRGSTVEARTRVVATMYVLSLCLGSAASMLAQETSLPSFRFQRIAIPEDRIDDVTGDLLPNDRLEFQQTIAELNARYRAVYGPAKPSIVRARYTAKLENGQFVDGSAELEIKHPHSDLAYLALSPLGIAVDSFRWQSSPLGEPQAGLLPNGEVGVSILKSDSLLFRWSLRSISSETSNGFSERRFRLSLPKAATNELLLDLPSGVTIECSDALISRVDKRDGASPDTAEVVRWRINLGATYETELRVISTIGNDRNERDDLVIARPTYAYQIGTTGLELQASFVLDIQRWPVQSLRCRVDSPLRIATAQLNGTPIDFTLTSSNEQEPNVLVFDLPTSLGDGEHELIVSAFAPTLVNKLWQLPQLQLLNVIGRQGNASIDVIEPLQVSRFRWPGNLLRSVEPLPAPVKGESRQVDLLTPDSPCNVLLSRQEPRLRAQTGTSITLSDSNVAAQFTAKLAATNGAVFSVPLRRSSGWILDSVETDPPQIDRVEEARGPLGLSRNVFLSEPITLEQPLTLIVKARRQLPRALAILGTEMRPISLPDDITESRLTAVRAELPLQLDISADSGLTRVTEMTAVESELLPLDGTPLKFRDGPNADRLRVAVRSQRPRYSGTIVAETVVESSKVQQSFEFLCSPMSTLVGSLRIRFSPAPSDEIQWSVAGVGPGALNATRLEVDGNEWEVHLRRPRSVPFEIRATLTRGSTPASGGMASEPEPIVLASLPDAETQVGTISIGTPDGSDFSLQHSGLQAIPMATADSDRRSVLRASYRYAPAQDVALKLTRLNNQNDHDAWIWDSKVTSRLDANGEVTHLMILRLENRGVSRITMKLPPNGTLERVDVDGAQIDPVRGPSSLQIAIPSVERFPVVRLRYKQEGSAIGNHDHRMLLIPEPELRCLNRSWCLWVPPGYTSATNDKTSQVAELLGESREGVDWENRLFGYSVLRRSGKPWNLLSLFAWGSNSAEVSRRDRVSSQVNSFLKALDTEMNSATADGLEALSWGTAITQVLAANEVDPANIPLYIDADALVAARIFPTSRLSAQATNAASAFRSTGLVFAGDMQAIVLTTLTAQAAGDFGSCSPIDERTFLTNLHGRFDGSRFVPTAEWVSRNSSGPTPWKESEMDRSSVGLVGWTNVRLPSADSHATIVLYRSETISTFGWAALFVAVAGGMWIGTRSNPLLLLLTVLAMAFAMLVPSSLIFIARSILLGLFAAVALLKLRRHASAPVSRDRPDDSLSFRLERSAGTATTGLLLMFVFISLATCQQIFGQEQLSPTARAPRKVFRVYDPIDNEGNTFGSHIYVPRAFLDSLDALKTTLSVQQLGPILTNAKYSLSLPDAPMATMLPELVVDIDFVSVGGGPTRVQLPFHRDDMHLLSATFDEQRVFPQWSQPGDSLEIDVETVDRHSLQFILRPVLSSDREGSGFDIRIPPIPDSHLSITGRNASQIEPTLSIGAITRGDDSVEARLGPTNRLAVRWPITTEQPDTPPTYTASQLMWLHVESQVITVDTQLTLSVISGSLNSVELLVDPRLRLLTADDQYRVTETQTPDRSLRRVRFQFEVPSDSNEIVTITPSFIMTDFEEGEIIEGPLLQVETGAINNPLLAVSTSSGIGAKVEFDGERPMIQPQDFAKTWGAMQLPQEVFQLPTNQSKWSLSISRLLPKVSGTDATELRIGQQLADVSYESQIDVADAPLSHLVLATSPEMKVASVQVTQDDVDLVHRYSQSDDGTTSIFLTAPLQGEATISLRGSHQLPSPGELLYQGIRLQDCATSERYLTVFRAPDVLVTPIANLPNRPIDTVQAIEQRAAGDRIVGIFELPLAPESDESAIKLQISPNATRYSGQIVTTVRSHESQWSIDAKLALRVTQGLVDSIRIRLPRELTETLRLEPPFPYEVREVPGQSEPNVIITPAAPVDDEFEVTLHAQLQTSPDGSLSAPSIEVLDSALIDRFLVLPKRSDQQEIEWDIRGLDQPQSDESQTTYQVRGQRMRAVVREMDQTVGNPRLLLADVEVAWQPDGRYVGLVSFDLEPGPLTRCDVIVPENVVLLHTNVDDAPAMLQHIDKTTANLELGAERLPQRIEMLFTGEAATLVTRRGSLIFAIPSLGGLEPTTTLWSVRDPSRTESSVPYLDYTMIDAAATRQLRVGVLEEILKYNLGPVPQHRARDLELWQERWQRRLEDAGGEARDESTPKFASIISLRDVASWRSTPRESTQWTYCSFDGATPTLTIIRRGRDYSDFAARVALALATFIIAWVLWRLSRLEPLRDGLSRWPHLPGVIFGIAWWLWLTPSVVGWLIATAFLASSLRPAWRSRAMR